MEALSKIIRHKLINYACEGMEENLLLRDNISYNKKCNEMIKFTKVRPVLMRNPSRKKLSKDFSMITRSLTAQKRYGHYE